MILLLILIHSHFCINLNCRWLELRIKINFSYWVYILSDYPGGCLLLIWNELLFRLQATTAYMGRAEHLMQCCSNVERGSFSFFQVLAIQALQSGRVENHCSDEFTVLKFTWTLVVRRSLQLPKDLIHNLQKFDLEIPTTFGVSLMNQLQEGIVGIMHLIFCYSLIIFSPFNVWSWRLAKA